MESKISQIYSKKLVSIKEASSLSDAEDLMNNYNIRHLPVVDEEDILVGVLSKSDFIALKHVDTRMKGFTVKELMSSPVKAVSPNAKIKEVAQLFIEKKLSCALVVNSQEAIGIITSEDLLRFLVKSENASAEAEQLDLAAMADEGWISMNFM